MKRRFLSLLLACLFILSMICVSAAAMAPAEQLNTQYQVSDRTTLNAQPVADESSSATIVAPYQNIPEAVDILNESSLTPIEKGNGLPASMRSSATSIRTANPASTPSIRTANLGATPCNAYHMTLGTNEMHLLQFSINNSKVMFSKFESSNAKYAFALYSVAADGTLKQETAFYGPNSEIKLVLSAGNYAFVIINTGTTYDNEYILRVNTSTPGNDVTGANVYKIYENYKSIIALVTSNGVTKVYCNGKFITNIPDTTNLNWNRVLDLKYGSGSWNYNKHEIYNAKVNDISFPGTFTSNYVNSNNAVVIFLGAGTGYMYNESKYSEISGDRVLHFKDPFRNETPRNLNSFDIATYQCWLIYDLDQQKSIDFWSSLNWYYATGTEKAAFVYN